MNMDVVILCGGLGTRLRDVVPDRPKPMAEIQDRPFLDHLLDYLRGFGLRRFILCTGFQAEVIRKYYADHPQGEQIVISHEPQPLGTAGAVKHAEPLIRTSPFLVTNGDSLCRADLEAFARFHQEKRADLSILLARCDDPEDYGSVQLDETHRIVSFEEKQLGQRHAFVSTGIYLFERRVLRYITAGVPQSLEYEIFPELVRTRLGCYGYTGQAEVIDIGTPKRLRRARRLFEDPPTD